MLYVMLQVVPAVVVRVMTFEKTDALTQGGQALMNRESLHDRTFESKQRSPTWMSRVLFKDICTVAVVVYLTCEKVCL